MSFQYCCANKIINVISFEHFKKTPTIKFDRTKRRVSKLTSGRINLGSDGQSDDNNDRYFI